MSISERAQSSCMIAVPVPCLRFRTTMVVSSTTFPIRKLRVTISSEDDAVVSSPDVSFKTFRPWLGLTSPAWMISVQRQTGA